MFTTSDKTSRAGPRSGAKLRIRYAESFYPDGNLNVENLRYARSTDFMSSPAAANPRHGSLVSPIMGSTPRPFGPFAAT